MKLRCKQLDLEFDLRTGSNVIGRDSDCTIAVGSDAKGVSRKHAECRVEHNRVQLRDLNSRNGTQLRFHALTPLQWVALKIGETFKICDYEFVLIDERFPEGSVVLTDSETSGLEDSSSIGLSEQALGKRTEPKQLDQLHALIRVTNALRGILETSEVLEEAAKILLDVFLVAERAVIGFVEEDASITPRWWHQRQADSQGEIRISKTIVDQVVSTGEAVLSNDAPRQFGDANSVSVLAIRAVICAPLFGENDQIVGFVYIDTRGVGSFELTDLQVMAAVATQISLALGYARMHESVVRDRLFLHDLEQARIVQEKYLPTETPNIEGYDISFFYRAARHVGGDYFDFIHLSGNEYLFGLGDVEGKGAPAALSMVQLATETRAGAELTERPADLLTRLNARMTEKWVTFAAVHLDSGNHTLQVANAGHELPLLRKADGNILELTDDSRGLPLSVLADESYEQDELSIGPGEMLVVYSDGFSDAISESDERFGKPRVLAALRDFEVDAGDFAASLCALIDNFCGQTDQFDDMCMICIQRIG